MQISGHFQCVVFPTIRQKWPSEWAIGISCSFSPNWLELYPSMRHETGRNSVKRWLNLNINSFSIICEGVCYLLVVDGKLKLIRVRRGYGHHTRSAVRVDPCYIGRQRQPTWRDVSTVASSDHTIRKDTRLTRAGHDFSQYSPVPVLPRAK